MATWFATAAGNINSAGRWNSLPNGTGTTLTWPPASGDVLMANGYIVTTNVNVDLGPTGQLRVDTTGGATAGGYFNLLNGITVTANVYGGSTTNANCVFCNAAGASITVIGNIYGGTGNSGYAVNFQSSGTCTIVGNIVGGSATVSYAVSNYSNGTMNVTGNISSLINQAYGLSQANPAGTTNITGNVSGCPVSGTNPTTILNISSGTINVIGNVSGDVGWGMYQTTTGVFTVSGYVQAGIGGQGITSSGLGTVTVGETRSASNGRGAVVGAFRYASATAAKSLPIIAGTQKTLSVLDVAALVPAAKDVREGVTYGDGTYTGTLPLNRKRTSMAGRF